MVTYQNAKSRRAAYFALGSLAIIIGVSMEVVTLVKYLYITADADKSAPFSGLIRVVAGLLYYWIFIVRWLWVWVPDKFDNSYPVFLTPLFIMGAFLVLVSGSLFNNAKKLTSWMRQVKALAAQQSMLASLRPRDIFNSQSTAPISTGQGDVNISQAIANHFNHKPDSPMFAISVAIVGAVISAVLGPLFSSWIGAGH